ncbi:unnamed protein product [Effrenium voratum]|uniref:Uncharacterized protein n=1 Tax=Effrenium voratum TaxID=2562239 RepID=A0AA36IUZ3_9DINO|nr:unnamed protein product [Effrenium voratum]CAJ1441677.1 unnamed protein product [Effrenium voratum]
MASTALLEKVGAPFERLARQPKVARYIAAVSQAGDSPKVQETLESLKPFARLSSRKTPLCHPCPFLFFLFFHFLSASWIVFPHITGHHVRTVCACHVGHQAQSIILYGDCQGFRTPLNGRRGEG